MSYFFDEYHEFIDQDPRKIRDVTTVSSESLHKRCSVLLPQWLVEGKTILDLGHCMGAFGHWALSHGAKHYTGVDIQKDFCYKSGLLLSKHWEADKFKIVCSDLIQHLNTCQEKYDIIIACGSIHGCSDPFEILKAITNKSNQYVVIETLDIHEVDYPTILFKPYRMNSKYSKYHYTGWSPIIGFNALRTVMNEYGYSIHGDRIYPERIVDGHDSYNDIIQHADRSKLDSLPNRFMVRYVKDSTIKKSLHSKIITNNVNTSTASNAKHNYIIVKPEMWKFDDAIAKRFQEEATNNIPDYERVIDICLSIAKIKVDSESTIVDVGSALGHTMNKFVTNGFNNVIGIESSQAMIDNSQYKDKVIISDVYPSELKSDFVMANWTLHFVVERKKYIQDVYDSLSDGGVFIISDKTSQTEEIKELYYDFKRQNGVSDEYIYEKEKKLQGYMHPYPADWYIETLKDIGFKNIQIINAKLGFVTFYCEK
jgi:tRNA (cmo5U34)-methyltransferase